MTTRLTVVSGVLWRSAGASGQRLLSFVVLMVLARLLSVQEFGTAATASMIVLLLYPVTRFGVYDYLIQTATVNDSVKTAAFVVSSIFGITLFITVFLLSPAISSILGDSHLVDTLRLISTIFIFAPISSVQEGLLAKKFKFKLLTTCQFAALLPSGLAGIGLAALGFGPLSIAVQHVTMVALTGLVMWFVQPWRPRFSGVGAHLWPMLRMGTSYTGGQFLSSINTNLFGLAVAAVGGTEAAGVFRVAWAGLQLCVQLTLLPVANVVQPLFAARKQDLQQVRRSYTNVMRYFAAVAFAPFAFVGVTAPQLVELAFGPPWVQAGPALAIMTVFAIPSVPNYLIRSFLSAIGHPHQTVSLAIAETLLSIGLLLPLASWGIDGVAAAVALRAWALLPVTLYLSRRYVDLGVKSVAASLVAADTFRVCFGCGCVYGQAANDLDSFDANGPLS